MRKNSEEIYKSLGDILKNSAVVYTPENDPNTLGKQDSQPNIDSIVNEVIGYIQEAGEDIYRQYNDVWAELCREKSEEIASKIPEWSEAVWANPKYDVQYSDEGVVSAIREILEKFSSDLNMTAGNMKNPLAKAFQDYLSKIYKFYNRSK